MAEPARWAALDPWVDRLRLPAGIEAPVVVACSGGADSLALLALAAARALDPVAVYVDHGLRPEAHQEGAVVARAAQRLGATSDQVSVAVDSGSNLEARARDARYQALNEAARTHGAASILVGHTADDQAETVLLNLLRGSGSSGLGAMAPARDAIVRPLLAFSRADTVEICARMGLAPLVDPMNADGRFRRVWIRRELLPLLAAGARRDVVRLLARQADVLRDEAHFLDSLADSELEGVGDGLPASLIASANPALARRMVRRWLGRRRPELPPPGQHQVDAVLAVAAGRARATEVGGGARVERSGGVLWCTHGGATVETVRFTPPGLARSGEWAVETWIERAPPVVWPPGSGLCVLDADAVGEHVVLRGPRRGDRFQPLGWSQARSLSGFLAAEGVPASDRDAQVVMTDATGTPLWILGYRVGAPARVTPGTRRYLWARATRAE